MSVYSQFTVLSEERKGLDVRGKLRRQMLQTESQGPTMDHVTLGKSFDRFENPHP